jgi:predicted NAD/FAD-binding protein
MHAQAGLPDLNAAAIGTTETFFCGAWTRYGFHEDGLLSAVQLARLLHDRELWLEPAASTQAVA